MIFFLILLSSTAVLAICRNRITLIFWLFITLVSAFRYKVGTDYPNYVNLYYDIGSDYQSYLHLEPFHYILNLFANNFELGPQFVIFVYSVLTNIIFALFFYKFTKIYVGLNSRLIFAVSTILFVGNYYFLSLNSIRSCLAASLYVLSLYYYLENKRIATLLLLLVGSCIHFTLIPVAFSTVLLLKFIFPVKRIAFVTLVVILLTNPISLVKYVFVTYQLMYYNYFLSDTYAVPANFVGQLSAYGGVLLALIFYYYFMYFIGINNNKVKAVFQISILLFIAFRIFSSELFIFARMSRYFSPVLYVFVAVAVSHYLHTKVAEQYKSAVTIGVFLILIISNIIIFMPRGLEDPSYGNYRINYCIYSTDVCDISISVQTNEDSL